MGIHSPERIASAGETSLPPNILNSHMNMVWASIVLAALFWFFEPVSYALLLNDGRFIQHWLQPDQDRIEMRTVIVCLLLLFGIYAQIMLGRQQQAYRQLKNNTQLLRQIVDNAHDAFFSIDATGQIIDWNPSAEKMFGWSRRHAIGQKITDTIISPEHRHAFSCELESFSISGQTELLNTRSEASLWHRDGYAFPAELSITPLATGDSFIFTGFVRDISERKLTEERLLHLAHTDSLTGLPNRQSFNDVLLQEISIAHRHRQQLAVMFLDLDQFKAVNDSLGHDAGDQLLCETAKRLQDCIRDSDTLARIGGDEFVFVLPNIRSSNEPGAICERILNTLKAPFLINNNECFIGASIGISLYPQDGDELETLEKHADIAMYRAKAAGKNDYKYYHADMSEYVLKRMELAREMHYALERNEFYVLYQPQIDINTGKPVGLESLVRWQHPDMGGIMPDEFISFAEESGTILSLGEFVLRTTCEQGKAWLEMGLPPMHLAVNFTPRQFNDKGLVNMITDNIHAFGLPAESLEVEITENNAMDNVEESREILHQLKTFGIGVAIDDFGTGFSSLGYLQDFPVSTLKIDKKFIAGITHNKKDAAIVTMIIELAHMLDIKVVAEGVETEEQLTFLRKHHCDIGQGYLFSKPLTAARVPEFWASSRELK